MKILIVCRKKEGKDWDVVKNIEKKLTQLGHNIELLSREEDLNMNSLSSSMGSLSSAVEKLDAKNSYDMIYTQDWSIALPFLIPTKILFEKHYCLFHDIEPSAAKSRILQKIVGNMMGEKLIVKTKELKEKFPKAVLSSDGVGIDMLK